MLSREIFGSAGELCLAVSERTLDRVRWGIQETGFFHLALTGGRVGNQISALIAKKIDENLEDYKGLHVWWSDERFLPTNSEERNSFAFLSHLHGEEPIHIHLPLGSDFGVDLERATRRYSTDIYNIDMDLTFLGVGEDGHVASLFPDSFQPTVEKQIISITDAPKLPRKRISFSMQKINSSDSVWMFAVGDSKREAVTKIIEGDPNTPAIFVKGRRETMLFGDKAAFGTE